jgi:hypothetical protein|tara:strand:+ start:57 stop:536 length:480 start_codon:yes stop_codon:yes gene_type:complete
MKEITVSRDMVSKARDKATEMGRLNNSITGGQGSVAGFLGEEVARLIIGGTEANTYDYDLILNNGCTVDVKTKRTTVPPKRYYECSVAELNTKQKCDYYAFVRVHKDLHTAWFLGVYPKSKYFEDSTYLKKGEVDPSNNFTVKSNCYNLPISSLEESPI